MPRRDVSALFACKRRIICPKRHAQSWFIDFGSRKCPGLVGISDRVTQIGIFNARERDDFASIGLLDLDTLESFVHVDGTDSCARDAIPTHKRNPVVRS